MPIRVKDAPYAHCPSPGAQARRRKCTKGLLGRRAREVSSPTKHQHRLAGLAREPSLRVLYTRLPIELLPVPLLSLPLPSEEQRLRECFETTSALSITAEGYFLLAVSSFLPRHLDPITTYSHPPTLCATAAIATLLSISFFASPQTAIARACYRPHKTKCSSCHLAPAVCHLCHHGLEPMPAFFHVRCQFIPLYFHCPKHVMSRFLSCAFLKFEFVN